MPEFEVNTIICGAMPEATKVFPDETVNCSISSPPYWALRDYGLPPTVWDGDKNCEHRWSLKKTTLAHENRNFTGPTATQEQALATKKQTVHIFRESKIQTGFCSLCGAWRGCLGLEPTFELYIKHLCDIYDEVWRVLRKDGTCFVNMGDTYSATRWSDKPSTTGKSGRYCDIVVKKETILPDKCLCLIPQRFAIEMVNRGWILRNVIVWHKPNPMPSSAKDRFTVDFEYVFFFVKQQRYWFEPQYEPNLTESNAERPRMGQGKNTIYKQKRNDYKKHTLRSVHVGDTDIDYRNPLGRNKRTVWTIEDPAYFVNWLKENNPDFLVQLYQQMKLSVKDVCPGAVWTIPTQSFAEAHFATFPEKLVEPMILSGCPEFVCKKCGMGRRKIYKQGEIVKLRGNSEALQKEGFGKGKTLAGSMQESGWSPGLREHHFKGYTDCGCNKELPDERRFRPGIVLDLFCGQLHHWKGRCKIAA